MAAAIENPTSSSGASDGSAHNWLLTVWIDKLTEDVFKTLSLEVQEGYPTL